MTTAHSRFMLGAVLLFLTLLTLPAAVAQTQSKAQISASDLVKAVIYNELHLSSTSDIHWKYRLEKQLDGQQETREVVETKSGSLDKLLSVSGRPLSDTQQRDETERILRFSHNADQQKKAEQARRKDAAQCDAFLRIIPDAFLFQYDGQYDGEEGKLLRITFKPNPQFRAPSREARVLQQMAGQMWIDANQTRLAGIDGQLTNEVKFGGGLLGHLEKGGRFSVKRAELAAGDWETTEIDINMRGKALLFKSISVQQKELHTNFERVPSDLSVSDAADLLLKQALVASR